MIFKRAKIGVAVLSLLAVLIPLYLFLNPAGTKESAVAVKEQGVQREDAEKVVPDTKVGNAANVVPDTKDDTSKNAVPDTEDDTETAKTDAVSEKTKATQSAFLVVIDPGHQARANLAKEPVGPGATETKMKVTGGTSGVATGKPEYKLALEASLVLGDLLESSGVKVIFTRTSHDVNLSNRERAEMANQKRADLFIRIHADGATDRNVHGLSVLTPAKNSPYTKAIFEDSLKASQSILDETSKNPAVKVNGISYRGDLSGFNWSKVPTTLVEMGFMSNPNEDRNLSDPVYLKNLMANVADGILQYAGYKK
ncbi:N-acetylmuramoyl-L-alanine amidase [Neobacillus soli]|uniref:N-acetylmuramoyl-L-alanine amidase n=1 Tax=Neobacillus soli TaxID=220688 RepID=UPI0008245D65|nr:N-acetylmuramoyl-L-alanine amidase [Neobacillus soli]